MEDIHNTTAVGGLRAFDYDSAEEAVASLSLGLCRKYHKEILDNNMSEDLLNLADGNESAMLEALYQRIKLLERQGRSKATFNVAHEFEVAPVVINFAGKSGQGRSTHIKGARDVDVECLAGIASHASNKLSGVSLEQTKLARRVAALVKHKAGARPSPQITNMPKMLRTVDYSSKAASLARAVDGQLAGLVRGVMTDFTTAAQVSSILYTRPPAELRGFISDHQGFKFVSKKLEVDIEPFDTEQANKKAIKEMLNVYPGQKGGPGNLAASHMDGIPLTGKMRTMLDHVQDFHYREADIYFFTGSKSQVYTSIYKSILHARNEAKVDKPFLVTYVSDNTISQKVLANFVELDERGDVKKVLKSGIVCGKVPPRGGPEVTTSYVDYTEPSRASKDKISLEADSARKVLLDRVSSLKGYTYYQVYASYLTLSFPVDYKKDEAYQIREAATWNEGEKYLPSVLGRKGLMVYTGEEEGMDAVAMSKLMINMIYHSIIYVYVGQHTRQFGEMKFAPSVSVDFSLESTIKTVASAITGGLTALGEVLGDKFKQCIDDKLSEVAWKKSQEDIEHKRAQQRATEADVVAAKLEIEASKKEIVDEDQEEELTLRTKSSKLKHRKTKKWVPKEQKSEEVNGLAKTTANFSSTEEEAAILFGGT